MQLALEGVRKLHFYKSAPRRELAEHALIYALSHWEPSMNLRVLADRSYIWKEGVDAEDLYERRLEAKWMAFVCGER